MPFPATAQTSAHLAPISSEEPNQASTSTATVISETPSTDGPPPKKKRRALPPSTNDISRLVSVVEIIKREWVKAAVLRAKRAAKAKSSKAKADEVPFPSLHQYNLVAALEDLVPEAGDQVPPSSPSPIDLELALSGKNHPHIQRTPYMKVYLCLTKLPTSLVGDATYQEPQLPPTITRSMKTRDRKRRNKLAANAPGGEVIGGEEGRETGDEKVGEEPPDAPGATDTAGEGDEAMHVD